MPFPPIAILLSASLAAAPPAQASGQDVPLSLYTSPHWPNGLDFGEANGISFGDYDGDGWPDLFVFSSGHLWRNLHGTTWVLAADLDTVLPFAGRRYGSAFGDYNGDGLADIATEPRRGMGDDCFHLLKNLGAGPNFVDVAGDPNVFPIPSCGMDAETIVWADLDGDQDLDLFVPAYPPSLGSTDNRFFRNLGPTGPGGIYRFTEEAASAGLLVANAAIRPEGAQVADTDGDGDLDLYCNGYLYQNHSALDLPAFTFMTEAGSGISSMGIRDEGVVFVDYDLDGDYDLLVNYNPPQGMRLWEARGDGTYFLTDLNVIEDHTLGTAYGITMADWDGDGDFDLQGRDTFRRNLWVEQGKRRFELVSHQVDPIHLDQTPPAWGDWDQDGDVDLALRWLYQNDLYGPDTAPENKRHLRVRVVQDSTLVPTGLETEFGASVEVRVYGEEGFRRRKQLVSSSSGYLNQNEYTLTFQLPEDAVSGLRFDLSVDFPGLQSTSFRRVDKFVNPALGHLELAALGQDREITVFRSGKVRMHGCDLEAPDARSADLITSTHGLIRPSPNQAPPDPVVASRPPEFVGIEIDTNSATTPLQVREILIDGFPGTPMKTRHGMANFLVWDVTDPLQPQQLPFGTWQRQSHGRNFRSSEFCNFLMQPGRIYRLVTHAQSLRATPISGPVHHGPFAVTGGLRYRDSNPASGRAVVSAALDPSQVYLSVRLSEFAGEPWKDLGQGVAGLLGQPVLEASGGGWAGTPTRLQLRGAMPLSHVTLITGSSLRCQPVQGVLVLPDLDQIQNDLTTDLTGRLEMSATWPANLGRGIPLFFQAFISDPTAPRGTAVSNTVVRLSED